MNKPCYTYMKTAFTMTRKRENLSNGRKKSNSDMPFNKFRRLVSKITLLLTINVSMSRKSKVLGDIMLK